jgi:hypothetical protein
LIGSLFATGLPASAREHSSESKFLLVSDLHFNPMADPSLVSDLAGAEPDKWESILQRTSPGSYSQYGSDTNWWLLKSALNQFPVTLRHPAFIMVTGDLLAHGFPETFRSVTHDSDQQRYQTFVLKTVQFLALQLQHQFPGTKIFITPGNNDNDCGDYTIEANGAFLSDTAAVARELAGGGDEFVTTWKSLGSFSVLHPIFSRVRIISLNSIFLSNKYQALSSSQGCVPVPTTAAADLMTWLEKELASAAQANEKFWLMFHIPPGIDGYASAMERQSLIKSGATDDPKTCGNAIVPMWVPEWTTRFEELLAKYSATVVAGFAGHTHSDDFRLIGNAGAERKFVLIDPAISPVYQQNPGFRVVTFSSGGMVTDQSTYFLTNLKSASSTSRGHWKKEYTFTHKWKAQELNSTNLERAYGEVTTSAKTRDKWLQLYAVSGPAEAGEKPIARELYCAVEAMTVESYRECDCGGSAAEGTRP